MAAIPKDSVMMAEEERPADSKDRCQLDLSRVQCTKTLMVLKESTKNDAENIPSSLLDYLVEVTSSKRNSVWCTNREMCDWVAGQLRDRLRSGQIWTVVKVLVILHEMIWRGTPVFVESVHETAMDLFNLPALFSSLESVEQENLTGAPLPCTLIPPEKRSTVPVSTGCGGGGGHFTVPGKCFFSKIGLYRPCQQQPTGGSGPCGISPSAASGASLSSESGSAPAHHVDVQSMPSDASASCDGAGVSKGRFTPSSSLGSGAGVTFSAENEEPQVRAVRDFLIENVSYLEVLISFRLTHPCVNLSYSRISCVRDESSIAAVQGLCDDLLVLLKCTAMCDPHLPTKCPLAMSVVRQRMEDVRVLYRLTCDALVRLLELIVCSMQTRFQGCEALTSRALELRSGADGDDKATHPFALLIVWYNEIFQFNRTVRMLHTYARAVEASSKEVVLNANTLRVFSTDAVKELRKHVDIIRSTAKAVTAKAKTASAATAGGGAADGTLVSAPGVASPLSDAEGGLRSPTGDPFQGSSVSNESLLSSRTISSELLSEEGVHAVCELVSDEERQAAWLHQVQALSAVIDGDLPPLLVEMERRLIEKGKKSPKPTSAPQPQPSSLSATESGTGKVKEPFTPDSAHNGSASAGLTQSSTQFSSSHRPSTTATEAAAATGAGGAATLPTHLAPPTPLPTHSSKVGVCMQRLEDSEEELQGPGESAANPAHSATPRAVSAPSGGDGESCSGACTASLHGSLSPTTTTTTTDSLFYQPMQSSMVLGDDSVEDIRRSTTFILRRTHHLQGQQQRQQEGHHHRHHPHDKDAAQDTEVITVTEEMRRNEEYIQALLQEDDVVVVCNEHFSCNDRLKLVDRFQILHNTPLGQGTYGKVFRAWDELMGCYLAAKELPLDKKKNHALAAREALQEYTVLTELNHPNIVRVVAFMLMAGTGRIFMEWMPSGSLQEVLKTRGVLRESVVCRYAHDALSGLAYLHSRGVLHRDIKPGNMLLSAEGSVKLTDFGTSHVLTGDQKTLQSDAITGTAPYMAPEAVHGVYSAASDIWALGCTVLELLFGRVPWSDPVSGASMDTVPLLFRIGSLNGSANTERPHTALLQYAEKVAREQRQAADVEGAGDSLLSSPLAGGAESLSLATAPSMRVGLSFATPAAGGGAVSPPAPYGSPSSAAVVPVGAAQPPPPPPQLSEDARDFLNRIFTVDRHLRPSAEELLQHPYMQRYEQMWQRRAPGMA